MRELRGDERVQLDAEKYSGRSSAGGTGENTHSVQADRFAPAYYPGTSGPLATTDHFGQFHDNPLGACYDGAGATIQSDTTQTIYVSDSYLVRTNSLVFKNLLGNGQVTNGVDASCTSNSNSDCGLTP